MSENNVFEMVVMSEALPVFRYKFMPETINELNNFAKVHRYDTREDFKEAWEEWIDTNDEIVKDEEDRLNNMGYKGDVVDKMYKSVRYYYRKKPMSKKEPSKRRKYFSIGKEILKEMDMHINKNHKNEDYTPAQGYDEFCQDNIELLREHIRELAEMGEIDGKSISDKIKKTYKNRYFRISRNMTILSSENDE